MSAAEIKKLREDVAKLAASFSQTQRQRIQARPRQPEVLDPTPMEIPVEMAGPPSMRELVQQYIREEMSANAQENDLGTFDEEDDFEPEDEDLLNLSGFEVSEFEMADEYPSEDAAPPQEAPVSPEGPSEAPPEAPPATEPPPAETPR